MNDTAPGILALVTERCKRMTPLERVTIASALFDAGRVIVESSLPASLAPRDRRLALARRLYGQELPEAALRAFADYPKC